MKKAKQSEHQKIVSFMAALSSKMEDGSGATVSVERPKFGCSLMGGSDYEHVSVLRLGDGKEAVFIAVGFRPGRKRLAICVQEGEAGCQHICMDSRKALALIETLSLAIRRSAIL